MRHGKMRMSTDAEAENKSSVEYRAATGSPSSKEIKVISSTLESGGTDSARLKTEISARVGVLDSY
jgi:hypothetical protein